MPLSDPGATFGLCGGQAGSAGELLQEDPPTVSDGPWCINTPDSSPPTGTAQKCVVQSHQVAGGRTPSCSEQ